MRIRFWQWAEGQLGCGDKGSEIFKIKKVYDIHFKKKSLIGRTNAR